MEVHEFLDQYSNIFPPDIFVDYHRTFLHNSYGVEIVRSKWGKLAEIAAFIHLYRDYYEGPLTRFSLDTILKRTPQALIYFNRLDHGLLATASCGTILGREKFMLYKIRRE